MQLGLLVEWCCSVFCFLIDLSLFYPLLKTKYWILKFSNCTHVLLVLIFWRTMICTAWESETSEAHPQILAFVSKNPSFQDEDTRKIPSLLWQKTSPCEICLYLIPLPRLREAEQLPAPWRKQAAHPPTSSNLPLLGITTSRNMWDCGPDSILGA